MAKLEFGLIIATFKNDIDARDFARMKGTGTEDEFVVVHEPITKNYLLVKKQYKTLNEEF